MGWDFHGVEFPLELGLVLIEPKLARAVRARSQAGLGNGRVFLS